MLTLDALKLALPTLPWRFARTLAHIPHWYIVRSPEIEDAYAALYHACFEQGVIGRWGKTTYHYWHPGDGWKYWPMDNDLRASRIINTARPSGLYLPGDGRPAHPAGEAATQQPKPRSPRKPPPKKPPPAVSIF